jgi:hypothetical protein
MKYSTQIALLALCSLLIFGQGTARAARVRFHYTTEHLACKNPPLVVGEEISWFGAVRQPCPRTFPPNRMACFRHPCTGANVTVPLCLPWGTPRIEHVRNKIVYEYTGYTVEVQFFPDGSVDVIYSSGLFRPL